jgi:hypothetical protein
VSQSADEIGKGRAGSFTSPHLERANHCSPRLGTYSTRVSYGKWVRWSTSTASIYTIDRLPKKKDEGKKEKGGESDFFFQTHSKCPNEAVHPVDGISQNDLVLQRLKPVCSFGSRFQERGETPCVGGERAFDQSAAPLLSLRAANGQRPCYSTGITCDKKIREFRQPIEIRRWDYCF